MNMMRKRGCKVTASNQGNHQTNPRIIEQVLNPDSALTIPSTPRETCH